MLRTSSSFLLLSFVVLAAGCSGAEAQDVLVSGTSSASAGSSGTNTSSGTIGNGSSGTTGTTGTSGSAGGTSSGGDPTCPRETEPNDTPATANLVNPKLCGNVGTSSDSKDYVTFTLPDRTKTLTLDFRGPVKLHVTVDSKSVDLTANGTGSVPFVTGKPYMILITPDTGGSNGANWQISVITN
jgi:hypothetical protein